MVLRGRDCTRPKRSRHAAQRSYPSLLIKSAVHLPRPRLFLGKRLGRAHRAYDENCGIRYQSRGDGAGRTTGAEDTRRGIPQGAPLTPRTQKVTFIADPEFAV